MWRQPPRIWPHQARKESYVPTPFQSQTETQRGRGLAQGLASVTISFGPGMLFTAHSSPDFSVTHPTPNASPLSHISIIDRPQPGKPERVQSLLLLSSRLQEYSLSRRTFLPLNWCVADGTAELSLGLFLTQGRTLHKCIALTGGDGGSGALALRATWPGFEFWLGHL